MYLDLRLQLMGEEGIKEMVSDKVYTAGKALLDDVLFCEITDLEASAISSGCEVRVAYDWRKDSITGKCRCHRRGEKWCEHTVALLLKILERRREYDTAVQKVGREIRAEYGNVLLRIPTSLPRFKETFLSVSVLGEKFEDFDWGLTNTMNMVSLAERMGIRDPFAAKEAVKRILLALGETLQEGARSLLSKDEDLVSFVLRTSVRAACLSGDRELLPVIRILAENTGDWEGISRYLFLCV